MFGRNRGTVGECHAHHLNGRGHRIRCIHAPASTRSGTRVLYGVEALLLTDVSGNELTVTLEGGNNVQLFAVAVPGLNGPAIDHQRGTVQASHGDETTGHVLVTAGDRDIGVI